MKKIIERLLIFLIGIPAIVVLVLYLPFYNNLIFNIVVILFSGIGAVEFSSMLEKKNIRMSKIEAFILGIIAPLAITLNVSLNLPSWLLSVFIMAGTGWVLLSKIFTHTSNLETVTNRLVGGFSVMIYPGSFMYWIVKMNLWENHGLILVFLFIIFGNDSIAWLAGTLFGKNNRGIIPASPNKSIAGFIGGLLGSVIVAGVGAFFFPSVFPVRSEYVTVSNPVSLAVIIGFITGVAATLGDLAESAIKRSCDCKDSGNLMLGRGGVLDSIDSIAAAAPVFYLLSCFFFYGF
jgi:phosphatidate cytidylyltransferase